MRANEVLREHDRLKSEFVSTVSHELRTPLCIFKNIISNALAGVMGKLSPKLQDNLRMADKSVDRLSRIIGDFLDISKIESGTLQLHCAEVTLQTIIEEVAQPLQALAAAKSIRIELDLPESDLPIMADRDRIIQVLTNLIGNAIKFIPVGGWIRVELTDQPTEVEIAVHDNGPGLTPEEMKKVFDRFVQIHKIAGAGEHGTGLGLTIAKNLVEMHHGRIWIESVPGCGCCFRFTLPKQISPLRIRSRCRSRRKPLILRPPSPGDSSGGRSNQDSVSMSVNGSQPASGGPEFFSQRCDMNVDDAILLPVRSRPQRRFQLFPRDDLAGGLNQRQQDVEFPPRQIDGIVFRPGLPGDRIDPNGAGLKFFPRLSRLGFASPKHRLDAGGQDRSAEGFGDIIIRPDRQPDDNIRLGVLGRQQDDGDRGRRRVSLEGLGQLDSGNVRQHDIQQDQVRPILAKNFLGFRSRLGG